MNERTHPEYHFSHIYNGLIFVGYEYYPMIEFKVKLKSNLTQTPPVTTPPSTTPITPSSPTSPAQSNTPVSEQITASSGERVIENSLHTSGEKRALFNGSNFKCAWFIVDSEAKMLKGPVEIDTEKIKSGVRTIKDPNYPQIDGHNIESVSNDPESIISDEDIPAWMVKHLMEVVHIE
jgi:hypothetical protein